MKRAICLLILCSFFLFGCTDGQIKPADASKGKYATLNANSAMEYSMYMNKQLTTCANILESRIIAVEGLESSTNSSELTAAEEGLTTIQECMDQIKVTVPSKTYESQRETALSLLDTTIQHYEKYLEALRKNQDVSSYKSFFRNDFNELTSLCTLFNQ